MIIQEKDYLAHVGVLGMKWHHHKTRNKVQSKISNIDKWGKDKDHNILYITGYSGSGKSTLANKFKDNNTNVIHLDPYFQKMNKNVLDKILDKDFTNYLDKNFPDYKSILNGKTKNTNNKEHWAKVDKLMAQTEKFAAQQYPNKKVIVEGVQLGDETTYPNKEFFKDKPLAITETSALTSRLRSAKRDGIPITKMIKEAKLDMKWYGNMNVSLSDLSKTANVKKGKNWAEEYLSKQQALS